MAAAGNLGHPLPPILTEKNYKVWSLKMRTLLKSHYYWEVVVIGFTEPDQVDLETMTNAQR